MDFSSHHTRLLKQLDEQRRRDLFCDCHILVEGQMFKAHCNVLFASSGYFKMLLSQSCRDMGQPITATFDAFSADTFIAILDFVYSGKLPLTGQNVIEVMAAASYLQMTDVISVCKVFIKSSLDISEKDGDGLVHLSGLQLGHCGLYNAGCEMDKCPSSYSDRDDSGCLEVSNKWNQFAFYPRSNNLSSTLDDKSTCQRASDRRNDMPQLPSSACPDERPRGCRVPELINSAFGADVEVNKSEYPATEEAFVNCWTVSQKSERRRLTQKSRASKADQLYATMPTIMGIRGGWGEDILPSMRFKCPFCTYMVKRKADLKRHLRCHTGERPYACQACGKRFTRQEHVRSHFRSIHEAGKPICRRCKRHVTEESGQVVQEGTRRYRLCNECMAEIGKSSFPMELDDDDPTIILSGDEDSEPLWSFHEGTQSSEPEIIEETSSDLIIHEVDDSDDEIKPIDC
ncbi:zinc finger and BTB domain-containing protein 8A.2-like [Spea bombifrons]|uniref:zinc finger and BTB domain-containing protein 8A.2-like n=1 Tax=Spea bombifrons TaxID=233779 RepID=UPI002349E4FA|nr:zinc finger and BTB domain-containing protein 8A.2-like [Spea bombifrons]